jgi:LysR family transcriptional regulator, hydrogen peroxide-inducible genes activator
MISLRQLQYLTALAEAGNFRRAAAACHVTQPALSTQVQQLEEGLGVLLVERGRRGAVMTAAGEEVVRRGRAILEDVTAIEDYARGMRDPFTGPLRLGVIPTIGPYLLPDLMPDLNRRYPALQLFMREEQTERLLDSLREGRLDLALLALPVPGDDLESAVLFQDRFLVAAPPGHPFAKMDAVDLGALADESLLLLEDGHCLRDQALAVCALDGPVNEGDFRATSLATLVQMVASGLGVTLLPEMARRREAGTDGRLTIRPLAPPEPGRQIGLMWRRTSGRKAEFRELAAVISEVHAAGTSF